MTTPMPQEVAEKIADGASYKPDEMWESIKDDRDACTHSHRLTVSITKKNILKSARAAKDAHA